MVTSTMQWFSNCDSSQYIIITFKLHQEDDRFFPFLYKLKFIILTFTTNKKNVRNYKALHSPLFINLRKFFTPFITLKFTTQKSTSLFGHDAGTVDDLHNS